MHAGVQVTARRTTRAMDSRQARVMTGWRLGHRAGACCLQKAKGVPPRQSSGHFDPPQPVCTLGCESVASTHCPLTVHTRYTHTAGLHTGPQKWDAGGVSRETPAHISRGAGVVMPAAHVLLISLDSAVTSIPAYNY